MNVQVKSSSGITLVPIESKLMDDREIFVEGEIDISCACGFMKKVMLLNQENSRKPIWVLVNAHGDDVQSGLLMYDVIQTSKAPVKIFCTGKAYSMAAILFAGGNHGRYMLPHAELMLNDPVSGEQIFGFGKSMPDPSNPDNRQETKRKLVRILAKHTGKSESEVEKAVGCEHYFDPKESIAFGLCDEIAGLEKIWEG